MFTPRSLIKMFPKKKTKKIVDHKIVEKTCVCTADNYKQCRMHNKRRISIDKRKKV